MIQYRGFKINRGDWIYGYYMQPYNSEKAYIQHWKRVDDHIGWSTDEVFPKTVGQLHNKLSAVEHYGEKVYVTDILDIYYKSKPSERMALETIEFWDDDIIGCEIIGNTLLHTLEGLK